MTGLKELDNFNYKRLIATILAALHYSFRTVDQCAIVAFAPADTSICTDSPIFPNSDNKFIIFGLYASDRLTTRPHDSKENLNTMDTVPIEVGMVLFQTARTERCTAEYPANFIAFSHTDNIGAKTQRRTRPARNVVSSCELKYLDNVCKIARHGLIDEDGLLRRYYGFYLLQMGPAVNALQQDAIYFPAQLFDAVYDFHAEIPAQLFGEFINSISGRGDIR